MNYESLGKYIEAKERSISLIEEVCQDLKVLRELSIPTSLIGYNFVKMSELLHSAQAKHNEMLAAISTANHEAPACEREVLKLSKY